MCLSRGVAPSDELSVLICAFSCHLSSKKDPSATQILTVETVAFSPSSASTERAEKKGTACRNTNGNGLFSSFGVLVENLLAPVIITQVLFSDKRPVRDPRHGAWAALDSLCGRRTKVGKTCRFSTSGASLAARIQTGSAVSAKSGRVCFQERNSESASAAPVRAFQSVSSAVGARDQRSLPQRRKWILLAKFLNPMVHEPAHERHQGDQGEHSSPRIDCDQKIVEPM